MRMWMVNPKCMCDKHLLGEHVELHMLVGSINRHRSLDGFIRQRILQPRSIRVRHAALVREMLARGFKHSSALPTFTTQMLPVDARQCTVDTQASYNELRRRCPACRALINQEI